MSIDPTWQEVDLPARARRLGDVVWDPGAVYVFDFDGVLCAPDEDDLYHMDPWPGEGELLARAARAFDVACGGMEIPYQRHLLYQAAALRLGMATEPGPAAPFLCARPASAPFFVLTARSGWQAVQRMHRFLEQNDMIPVEIFHVGRVKKDRQIEMLTRAYPGRRIVYVEDNPAHLAMIDQAGLTDVDLVWAARSSPRAPEATLRAWEEEVLGRALDFRVSDRTR